MSKRENIDFLHDIQESVKRIISFSEQLTYEQFLDDIKTQDAVIRNIEIIGEATKNITDKLRSEHPEIPWKGLAGTRDKLIHNYFGVNLDIVWNIIKNELPEIELKIEKIIKIKMLPHRPNCANDKSWLAEK